MAIKLSCHELQVFPEIQQKNLIFNKVINVEHQFGQDLMVKLQGNWSLMLHICVQDLTINNIFITTSSCNLIIVNTHKS